VFAFALVHVAALADVTGKPKIVDGDSLEIAGQQIRLHGIDAVEAAQTCRDPGGEWRCGFEATAALAFFIAGNWVTCIERDRDRYGRTVATCYAGGIGGPDIGRQMVREGWALAYRRFSTDYVAEEDEARANRRGIWRGDFVPPWDWRQGKRLTAPAVTPGPSATQPPAASPRDAEACCKVCRKGKACGDSCIGANRTCRQPPGCACDG
jgi:endonuclease YncB( thermonuclease family)